jgi:hypothetical protein
MNRTILASLLIAAVTPALAGQPMHCVFDLKRGGQIIYSFEKVTDTLFAEVSFIKNGTQTTSPIGQRPPWIVTNISAGMTMTYARDRRFWIGIPNGKVYRDSSTVVMGAILAEGKSVVGTGGCGFLVEDQNADDNVPDGL